MNRNGILLVGFIALIVSCGKSVKPSVDQLQAQQTVLGVLWVQESGEYEALCYQAFNSAKDKFVAKKSALPAGSKLAVIMDVDETVLANTRNAAQSVKTGVNHSSALFAEWSRMEKASAIPGAVDFVKTVTDNGGEVFFITDREESLRAATLANLRNEGFVADDAHLILKNNESGKESRRQAIRDKGYVIAMLVGDNLNDLAVWGTTNVDRRKSVDDHRDDFGSEYIVIPNPLYGAFESGIAPNYYKDGAAGIVKKRLEALIGWND